MHIWICIWSLMDYVPTAGIKLRLDFWWTWSRWWSLQKWNIVIFSERHGRVFAQLEFRYCRYYRYDLSMISMISMISIISMISMISMISIISIISIIWSNIIKPSPHQLPCQTMTARLSVVSPLSQMPASWWRCSERLKLYPLVNVYKKRTGKIHHV